MFKINKLCYNYYTTKFLGIKPEVFASNTMEGQKMREDLELINRFLSGEMEAFEMLVRKYQNRVINTAYSLAGNVSDAEDIAQDVFLKIYHGLSSFKAKAKFSSWLYRITVNTAYDFLRGHKHKAESLEESDCENIRAKENNPDLLTRELIQGALGEMPFDFRSVLTLREIEGLSYEEISQALKINIGTVESRLFRARRILKGILIRKGALKNV